MDAFYDYTYTWPPPVSKSQPKCCSEASLTSRNYLGLNWSTNLENFKLRLPVTDQTSAIFGSTLFIKASTHYYCSMEYWRNW